MRELEHHVQKAVVLCTGKLVRASDLGIEESAQTEAMSLRSIREQTDHQMIVHALRRNCGNISKAAEELDISRPSLHDLLRKHGIDATQFRSRPQGTPHQEKE